MTSCSARGTTRRLQALAVMGHNMHDVIGALPHGHDFTPALLIALSRVRSGLDDVVDMHLAAEVTVAYRALVLLPGLHPATAAMARGLGWTGPVGWHDPDDDPEPLGDEPDDWDELGLAGEHIDEIAIKRALRDHDARPLTRAERLEAVRRLGGLGVTPGSLAHQLGLSTNVTRSLQKRLADIEIKALAAAS